MEFSNWLGGLLRSLKSSGPQLTIHRNLNKRELRCESLEQRRMLTGVTAVPQTEVNADPIDDVIIAGASLEGQNVAASNNLVDAGGLGAMAAAASSSSGRTRAGRR